MPFGRLALLVAVVMAAAGATLALAALVGAGLELSSRQAAIVLPVIALALVALRLILARGK